MNMSIIEVWIITWSNQLMVFGMLQEYVVYWSVNYHMKLSANGLWNVTWTRKLERELELGIAYECYSCFVSLSGICSCFENIRVTKCQVRARTRDQRCTERVHRPACNAAEVTVPSIIHGWTTCDILTIISKQSSSTECRKKCSFSSSSSSAICVEGY